MQTLMCDATGGCASSARRAATQARRAEPAAAREAWKQTWVSQPHVFWTSLLWKTIVLSRQARDKRESALIGMDQILISSSRNLMSPFHVIISRDHFT
jgi:hypothetical protein